MNIKPVGDRLLVKAVKEEETTKSGIVLPESVSKEKRTEGEIIAIGSGEKVSQLGLKVGQKVLYSKYGGDEIKIGEEEHKIIGHEDVLAIIE
ncbi:MAG: 10 kDa chaperonin [Parcubacteria group bacterium ADurb.Bin326]|nr:MAG: 10 kDa chaperonin [Parcubacteria group bacterium ADurb.Bin326]